MNKEYLIADLLKELLVKNFPSDHIYYYVKEEDDFKLIPKAIAESDPQLDKDCVIGVDDLRQFYYERIF